MCMLILGLSTSQSKARSIENTNICNPSGKPLFNLVQSLTLAKYYVKYMKEKFMSSRIQSSHCPVVECAKNALNFTIDTTTNINSIKEDMTTFQAIRWVINEMRRSEADLFYIEILNNLKIAVNNALSSLGKILISCRNQPTEPSLHQPLCPAERLEERYFRGCTLLNQIEHIISESEQKYEA
ncbi:hypothetical protein ACJMK2_005286 [Sinanodonta woodiana]|uniref:Interleukin-6 n=1 Tax=Sinanodonta woodiana TaxID=1069815 RepID=A0ABD3VPK6_SINWO